MTTFYATYSPSAASGAIVTANQGTTPWLVAGTGTAGTANAGVVTVQGIAGGTAIPISGSITATNPSVSTTGTAVPASATLAGGSDGTNLRALKVSATGVLSVDGSASTQPISGTVAATQSGTWNIGTLTSITNALPAGTNVIGHVIVDSAPTTAVTQSGTWTVQPGNTANTTPWLATIAQGGNSATVSAGGALKVDASGSTQPVSGTVTVTQATGTNLHTVIDSGTLTTVSTVTAVTAITNALPAGTNAIGSVIATATAAATFQAEGSIPFGSITNAYTTIFTPSASTKILQMRNNTNAAISVSFDAGTTLNYVLDAGDQVSLDLVTNGLVMTTTAIQIKYTSGAPTSGSFRVNGAH